MSNRQTKKGHQFFESFQSTMLSAMLFDCVDSLAGYPSIAGDLNSVGVSQSFLDLCLCGFDSRYHNNIVTGGNFFVKRHTMSGADDRIPRKILSSRQILSSSKSFCDK